MKKNQYKKTVALKHVERQRGATLLEVITYMGIAALIVILALSLYNSANANAQSNQTTEEMSAIRTAVKKIYASQNNTYPAGNLNALLVAAGAFPSTLTATQAGVVTSGSGGQVVVFGSGTATFTVTYSNVSKEVCVNVLSGANGWVDVGSATGSITAPTAQPATATAFPLTPANMTALCNANAVELTLSSN